ncbi:MAG: cystathionine beta-lyase [Blastocatellia bacterium]|nr:MAG: cystathionine beta-lyase [Blastocatellia bacterium]
MKTSTRCVHLSEFEDQYGATVPPIYQTATFQQSSATEFGEYDYSRSGNPTRTVLETHLAELENGRHASAFASGMAAITALTRLLNSGDEIIAGNDLYGGTVRLLGQILPRQGIGVRYVDTSDVDAVRKAVSSRSKLLLVETPSNPFLRISDIRRLGELAHDAGAWLAVDNSMLSPIFQQPLDLGADFVIHSATKFLSGHSDITAGVIVTKSSELHEQIAFQQNAEGAGLSPFESWLLIRGLKTLSLRVERQNHSAARVAQFLQGVPEVKKVYHPSLIDHAARVVHLGQATGDGAVISFITGDEQFSKQIVEGTKLFSIAVSFGSVASTISLPYCMSHASIPPALRDQLAPPSDLVRLSVGIEDVDDLIEDLSLAIQSAIVCRGKVSKVAAARVC